jgi:pilus assembly protein FimV
MMQHKHLITSICALALAWAGAAPAAELGDVVPRSYIGQPLAVDIDLLALTPEEVAGLQVRLADANVYRGANVTMNPALASARFQVERRGQKSVVHVTTTRAVDADYVHVYLELGVPGKQDVRLATVWLQRDPNPPAPVVVAPPVPLASAMTPAQAEQIAGQARATRAAAAEAASKQAAAAEALKQVAAAETAKQAAAAETVKQAETARQAAAAEAARQAAAAEAARQATAAAALRDRSKPAPLPSLHEAETGTPGEVKAARRIAGVWVTADGKPTRAPTSEDAVQVPVNVAQALLPLPPLPLPKGVKRPAPASCTPGGISAKECVALDQHNAELSSKLMELEGKMKALQGALGGTAPAAATMAAQRGKVAAPATAAAATAVAAAAAPSAASAMAPKGGAASTAGHSAAAPTVGPAASATSATASLSARSEPEAHAAKAAAPGASAAASSAASAAASASSASTAASSASTSASSASSAASAASASAPASASASEASASAPGEGAASAAAASVPTRQVRVLPKLKYNKKDKDKPAESASYTLPLVAGAVGLLALLGAGLIWWRKKKSGSRGPLKIWQGFRKKRAAAPDAASPVSPAGQATSAAASAPAAAEPVTS